jgi:hypothetical protein
MVSRKLVDRSASPRNARLSTDGLLNARKSRTSVERISFVRMGNERRSLFKQRSSDSLATKKLAGRASIRAFFSEHRVSQPKPVSIIHFTSEAPEHHRMSKLSYGHLPKNQALYQGLRLSERRFDTMDNTTLKTESFLSIGLPVGTIQKSIANFRPAEYSSWSEKANEYVRGALATLTVIWPALTVWKQSVLESLTSLDVPMEFSSKIHHFNGFFIDKVKFCNVSRIIFRFTKKKKVQYISNLQRV